MKNRILSVLFLGLFGFVSTVIFLPNASNAQGIEQLLLEKIPVPTKRPSVDAIRTGSVPSRSKQTSIVVGKPATKVSPIAGSLESGLKALSKKDGQRALQIRAGLKPGSLDRKILAWAIALSGNPTVTSGEIASIARDLPHWPGRKALARNSERALVRENLSARSIVRAFGNNAPQSVEGAISLASAHLALGNRKSANRIIAPFWRNEKLNNKLEKQILSKLGGVLTQEDHRYRMHSLLYNDRARGALRIAGLAKQSSLAKARAAVVRKSSKASSLLKSVAPSSKKDTGYLFARIEHARRTKDFKTAANLLVKAPRNPALLVNPDEWWVERRIVSRQMLEAGNPRLAYKLVSEHSAQSASKIIDAEFHAGWYSLRFLNDRKTAQRHFTRILQHATRPISIARGHYWLGRSLTGGKAQQHFQLAAKHAGTYYGQLAAAKLGQRSIVIRPASPTPADRRRYKTRELVRAIQRLEAVGFGGRASILYQHLARTMENPGEIAILAAAAERKGDYSLSLQVGKLAHARGLAVDNLAWPIGAIPGSAKIGNSGRALAYAIARQESAFNKRAISPANARGLLQLLPGTAKAVAKKKRLKYSHGRLTSDAGYNATLGAAYLDEQLDNFGNSYILTFAGYNAGPSRVREWLERFGDPRGKSLDHVIDWVERIPFTETRSYVQRVMENYQVYKKRLNGNQLAIVTDLRKGRR
ncbi:MAG: lytic transglycosylase domain-containing protein [Pseudomonadota bacterium]